MRILVCGGRDFGDIDRHLQHNEPDNSLVRKKEKEYKFIFSKLEEVASKYIPSYPSEECQLPFGIEIIAGKARGVDSAAIDWAVVNWLNFKEFPADWDRYGKSAGYIRNKQMLDEGKPDLVVAFPGGKGTKMMVDLARKAGVKVIEFVFKQQ